MTTGPEDRMPWYIQWIVGVAAWVTAIVLMLLAGAILYSSLDLKNEGPIAVFGAAYLLFGLWLIRQQGRGVFAEQLAIAVTAAGAGLVVVGVQAETDNYWLTLIAALIVAAVVVYRTTNRVIQFLVTTLAAGVYVAALTEYRVPYFIDLVAIATPLGLYLFLKPRKRDLMAVAAVLLLLFPVVSAFPPNEWHWMKTAELGGMVARILHIAMFLGLSAMHWRFVDTQRARNQLLVFAVIAVIVCLLLPPGGSAAMLLMMLAYVVGSKPLALAGSALQAQFVVRYYYSLQMNLLDKSLLLVAVGVLLLGVWWFLQRQEGAGEQR